MTDLNAEDIRRITREEIRKILDAGLMYTSETKAVAKPKIEEGNTEYVDDLKLKFPEDLESLLTFEDRGKYIKISPKQFLGSENFAKISNVVRGIGGKYVSAGKNSHFEVPK